MFERGAMRNLWRKLSRSLGAAPAQDPSQAPPAQESVNERRKWLMVEEIVGDDLRERIQRQGGLADHEVDVAAGLSKQKKAPKDVDRIW